MNNLSPTRNRLIQRFRTIKIKSTTQSIETKEEQLQNKKKNSQGNNHSNHYNNKYEQMGSKGIPLGYENIVERLERHVEYLERRMKEMEEERGRLLSSLSGYEVKLMEKQEEIRRKDRIHEQWQVKIKRLQGDKEKLQMDNQGLSLKNKMQRLNNQIQTSKDISKHVQLKHKNRQGKFSTLLPSPFPITNQETFLSPHRVELSSFQNQSLSRERETFGDCLNQEYRRVKNDNKNLEREVYQLRGSNGRLQDELRESREVVLGLKCEQARYLKQWRQMKDNLQLKLKQCKGDNHLMMSKLKTNEMILLQLRNGQDNPPKEEGNSPSYQYLKEIKKQLSSVSYNLEIRSKNVELTIGSQRQGEMELVELSVKREGREEQGQSQLIQKSNQIESQYINSQLLDHSIITNIKIQTQPSSSPQQQQPTSPINQHQEEQPTQNHYPEQPSSPFPPTKPKESDSMKIQEDNSQQFNNQQ